MILAPLLSEMDLRDSSEGSIDPLGTYTIAEALATRLVPGVRERQRHPRFLTATAVSLAVCSHHGDDDVAADGITPPWQVFEWYVVEGLVRTLDKSRRTGLPGSAKVESAIRDGVPVSASRYLKTPSIFGFHGVYRVLTRQLGIEQAGRLGEAGFELLTIWSREQGLAGFWSPDAAHADARAGAGWRRELAQAVDDGLRAGASARAPTWKGWAFFGDHLSSGEPGPRERQFLWDLLRQSDDGHRRAVIDFLVSPAGRDAVAREEPWELRERRVHRKIAATATPDVRRLVDTILAYETFARMLQNAFDDCLVQMTRAARKVRADALTASPLVQQAVRETPGQFSRLVDRLADYGLTIPFQERFGALAERAAPAAWIRALLEHHTRVQRQKPPAGREPWMLIDSGEYLLRPLYRRDTADGDPDAYAHTYRTAALWQFAMDLGKVT